LDFCSVGVYPQGKTVAHKGQRYGNVNMSRDFGSKKMITQITKKDCADEGKRDF